MNTTRALSPGQPVWRIAPCGTTQVFLDRFLPDGHARVFSRGRRSKWAAQPMLVSGQDLFATRTAARAEYRRRRAIELTRPRPYLNLTTDGDIL